MIYMPGFDPYLKDPVEMYFWECWYFEQTSSSSSRSFALACLGEE
jgi:hypothetical protein